MNRSRGNERLKGRIRSPVWWCGVRTAGGEGHQRWIVDWIGGTILLLNSLKSGQRRSHERPFADSRFTDLRRFTGVGRLTIRLTFDNRASRLSAVPFQGEKSSSLVTVDGTLGTVIPIDDNESLSRWNLHYIRAPPQHLRGCASPFLPEAARIFLIVRGWWTLRTREIRVPSRARMNSFVFFVASWTNSG